MLAPFVLTPFAFAPPTCGERSDGGVLGIGGLLRGKDAVCDPCCCLCCCAVGE